MSARIKAAFVLVLVLGAGLRLALVAEPPYHHGLSSWREADYTQIARNFHREGMSPLYPRVDWREDTAGFVEMELPILPWGGALLYRLFGYDELLLRALSGLFGIGGLIAFALLARRLLPPAGALVAMVAFAANWLLVVLSTSLQPEPVQLLLTILAAGAALDWTRDPSPRRLLLAAALTAIAILAKSPAAYLGFLLAYLVLRHQGRRAFRDPWVYSAALVALLPPAAWYGWAHRHYLTTGLSLGVSNETHLINLGVLASPAAPLWWNLRAELFDVFAVAGVPLALGALVLPWRKIEGPAVWYLSVLGFYLLIADTSGDPWASYYHANSVAPACLLIGLGFLGWKDLARRRAPTAGWRRAASVALTLLVVLTVAGFAVRGTQYLRRVDPRLEELYRCSGRFAETVPADGKIVFRGGARLDTHGHPVAYNASPVFTWTDRRGFNYAQEDFGPEELERIRQRGGRYWIAGSADLEDGVAREAIEHRFELLDSCGTLGLYDLEGGVEAPARLVRGAREHGP